MFCESALLPFYTRMIPVDVMDVTRLVQARDETTLKEAPA
jgi:hypothetical protein